MVTLDANRIASQAETSDKLRLDPDTLLFTQREMVRRNQGILRRAHLSLGNCFRMNKFGQTAGIWPIVNLEDLVQLSGRNDSSLAEAPSRFRESAGNQLYQVREPSQDWRSFDMATIPMQELETGVKTCQSDLEIIDSHSTRTWQFHFPAPFMLPEEEEFLPVSEKERQVSKETSLPSGTREAAPGSHPKPLDGFPNAQLVGTEQFHFGCTEADSLQDDLRTIVGTMLAKKARVLTAGKTVYDSVPTELQSSVNPDSTLLSLCQRLGNARRKARLQQLRAKQDDVARIDAFTGAFQSLAACLIMISMPPILLLALAAIAEDLMR